MLHTALEVIQLMFEKTPEQIHFLKEGQEFDLGRSAVSHDPELTNSPPQEQRWSGWIKELFRSPKEAKLLGVGQEQSRELSRLEGSCTHHCLGSLYQAVSIKRNILTDNVSL